MKKKLLPAILVITVLLSGAALAVGGSLQDPLTSLNYLTGTFRTSLMTQVDKQVTDTYGAAYDAAARKLDEETAVLRTQSAASSSGSAWKMSGGFVPWKFARQDTVTLITGSGLLITEGAASALASGGEIIDVTAGTSSTSMELIVGHRYLVGEGASVKVTVASEAARLGVTGAYQTAVGGAAALPFTDLARSDWYYEAVKFAYDQKLFNGVSEDHFAPGERVTRAMLSTVLFRLAGAPAQSGTGSIFSDVIPGEWYEAGIRWSSNQGIVNGIGEGRFAPQVNVTREQLAVMLYRYAGEYLKADTQWRGDLAGFGDQAKISDWAREGLSWAVGTGIMNGDTNSKLNPGGSASRAEAATMIQRFANWIP